MSLRSPTALEPSSLLKIFLIALFIRTCTCNDCHNNTQGPSCSQCEPLFVEYAVNGTQCLPCKDFCHGHTELCFSTDLLAQFQGNNTSSTSNYSSIPSLEISQIEIQKFPGPKPSNAICYNCLHNTEGERCDSCSTGFFKTSESIVDGCIPCHCHGHGDVCDPVTGEDCNCSNNTETPRECLGKHVKGLPPCWQLQCARCKEYFLGVPTHGHQCYRHLFLDKDYCFDPETHDECSRFPSPLTTGRAVFFAVQPRYMNVDIRVIIDVTSGIIDLYMSSKEDTFIVDLNKTSNYHDVWLDSHYELMGDDIPSNMILVKPSYKSSNDSDFGTLLTHQSPYKLKVRSSEPSSSLVTYVTLEDSNELLLVRGLRNRLVVTVPQELHDLRSKRFYVILKGSTIEDSSEESNGNLFVRQDQSRIDLFVFFSVFFSCFFLFLASCVLFWKIKQAFDLRTARRLHVAEMKHLASRPFATVPIHLPPVFSDDSDSFEFALSSPAKHLPADKKQLKQLRVKDLKESPKHMLSANASGMDNNYLIRPVAVEPTSDGVSAVLTTLIILPGASSAPVRMTLATTLVNLKSSVQNLLQSNQHATTASGRNDLRKIHPSNVSVVQRSGYH